MNRARLRAALWLLVGLAVFGGLSVNQLHVNQTPPFSNGGDVFAQSGGSSAKRTSVRGKRPIRKRGLIEALRINGLSTAELVREIERRGVDFLLTDQDEADLIAAGATPEIIAAVRANYRGEATTGGVNNQDGEGAPGDDPANSGAGPPGDWKNEETTGPPEPDYDAIFDQGLSALRAERFDEALMHFTTLASLQPSDPRPFSMMGMTYLYWKPDLAAAESNMRRAVALGGSAIFRVRHDHDGFFVEFCTGSLFISAGDITFRADDGKHTFAATRDVITEVKLNSFVGSEYGAFHIKVRAERNKAKNYNFAPSTNQRYEAELALRLYREGRALDRQTVLRD